MMTTSPHLVERGSRFAPTLVQPCIACSAPVRKARVLTEITIMLDATPTRRGSYYFSAESGIVSEDRGTYSGDPTYRRHRCQRNSEVMDGWSGEE